MGLKFNPPPGWPLPWNFEPGPGWEPDPAWPPMPPNWPLWIGSDAPPPDLQVDPRVSYVGRHSRRPLEPRSAGPALGRPVFGYPAQSANARPGQQTRPAQPGQPGKAGQPRRSGRRPSRSVLKFAGMTTLATVVIVGGAVAAYRQIGTRAATKIEPVSFSSLRQGACFQEPPGQPLTRGLTVGVTAVSCTAAHSAQVIARFPVTGHQNYPGRTILVSLAARDCKATITAIEKSKAGRSARVLSLFPDPLAWKDGIRAISCVAVDESRALTASLVPTPARTPGPQHSSANPGQSASSAHHPGGGSVAHSPKSRRP